MAASESSLPADYDEARDPALDLEIAVGLARSSGRRVLLEVGGEWCSWCHILDRFLAADEEVERALEEAFVVLRVNYSPGNENREFQSQYPPISGYPHLFVLDEEGAFLHSQGTGVFEEGRGYDRDRWLAFVAESRTASSVSRSRLLKRLSLTGEPLQEWRDLPMIAAQLL